MKLYAIWCTRRQRFYVRMNGLGEPEFQRTPKFWSTPDGVSANLLKLGGTMTRVPDERFPMFEKRVWRDFQVSRLDGLVVRVLTVDVLTAEDLPVQNFVPEEEAA